MKRTTAAIDEVPSDGDDVEPAGDGELKVALNPINSPAAHLSYIFWQFAADTQANAIRDHLVDDVLRELLVHHLDPASAFAFVRTCKEYYTRFIEDIVPHYSVYVREEEERVECRGGIWAVPLLPFFITYVGVMPLADHAHVAGFVKALKYVANKPQALEYAITALAFDARRREHSDFTRVEMLVEALLPWDGDKAESRDGDLMSAAINYLNWPLFDWLRHQPWIGPWCLAEGSEFFVPDRPTLLAALATDFAYLPLLNYRYGLSPAFVLEEMAYFCVASGKPECCLDALDFWATVAERHTTLAHIQELVHSQTFRVMMITVHPDHCMPLILERYTRLDFANDALLRAKFELIERALPPLVAAGLRIAYEKPSFVDYFARFLMIPGLSLLMPSQKRIRRAFARMLPVETFDSAEFFSPHVIALFANSDKRRHRTFCSFWKNLFLTSFSPPVTLTSAEGFALLVKCMEEAHLTQEQIAVYKENGDALMDLLAYFVPIEEIH
jgi:hypothetical protein